MRGLSDNGKNKDFFKKRESCHMLYNVMPMYPDETPCVTPKNKG